MRTAIQTCRAPAHVVPRLRERAGCGAVVMAAETSRRSTLVSLALASASVLGPPGAERASAFGLSSLRQLDRSIEQIFQKNTPSVVFISTYTQARSTFDLNSMIEVPQGTGSGIVWDADGHVVTNYHVIRAAQEAKVTVTREGGMRQVYDARLVGANPDKDVAVLQLLPLRGESAVRTTPVRVGSSNSLHVGQVVFAIGARRGREWRGDAREAICLGMALRAPATARVRPLTARACVPMCGAALVARRRQPVWP